MGVLKAIAAFWKSGIPVTKEIYALVREILVALLAVWAEASPEDSDSPNVLTGKEILMAVFTHIGGKLLPPLLK